MDSTTIAIIVLSATTAIFGGNWAFAKIKGWDDKTEVRRKAGVDLVTILDRNGFDRVAELAKCYAVGDYDGLKFGVEEFIKELLNPETASELLNKAFIKTLPIRIANDVHREQIRKALREYDLVKSVTENHATPTSPVTPTTPATPTPTAPITPTAPVAPTSTEPITPTQTPIVAP